MTTDVVAAQARALREAAADLLAMTMDPFDLLAASVGTNGPIAVALWLQDRANSLDGKTAND